MFSQSEWFVIVARGTDIFVMLCQHKRKYIKEKTALHASLSSERPHGDFVNHILVLWFINWHISFVDNICSMIHINPNQNTNVPVSILTQKNPHFFNMSLVILVAILDSVSIILALKYMFMNWKYVFIFRMINSNP